MAFTKALYYPTIDIQDEAWLKNAMLYWNEIHTIVPSGYGKPYQTRTSQEFADAGLLLPLKVQSRMPEIVELTEDVYKYFDTPEGKEVLMPGQVARDLESVIHKHKLPGDILKALGNGSLSKWVSVDERFADFYMTLLATRLSGSIGAGLLTFKPTFDRLATVVRIDAPLSPPANHPAISGKRTTGGYRNRTSMPLTLAQGMLANLIIEQIAIDPDTPVKKILQFRTDHTDELGRFRVKIAELTATISENLPYERLQQEVKDIYTNEIGPTINALKKGLTDSKILWAVKGILTIAGLSTSSLALIALAHMAAPYTLLADAGILLTLSAIQYNRERTQMLRHEPYTFVLEAEKALPRRR